MRERVEEEEERKEEDKRNRNFVCLVFSTLLKISRTYTVGSRVEQQRDAVCKLFELLCFVFLGAAPIPYCMYVQAAILNVPH